MLQISPIAFTSNEVNNRRLSDEKREDIRDTAVAGGAAGAGYTAVKGGGLNMAKKLKDASSTSAKLTSDIKKGMQTVNESKKAVTGLAKEANGIFRNFKLNAQHFTENMLNSLKNMKAGKLVQKFVKTPAVKYGCKVCGGFLAGCVLISGLGTLYNNTTKVVDHYAPQLAENLNNLADSYNKTSDNDDNV